MIVRRKKWLSGRPVRALACIVLSAVLVALFFPGCQAGYLRKQAGGALRLIRDRVEIDSLPPDSLGLRERDGLRWAARVREFAQAELGLDPGDSYTTYYDTKGAPISYIVVASHPLALEPYRWRFPIAGKVPYKGYFDPKDGRAERDRLLRAGWDAVLLPVGAFSSLGWMSDPILSNMVAKPRGELADLLIHEIAHRTVYFPDHTDLNESLATVVAREGTRLLLQREFGQESREEDEYRRHLASVAAEKLRDGLVDRLRSDLDALYRSRLPDSEKLKRKAEMFATANVALEKARAGSIEPSNAVLVLDRQYTGLIPTLERAMAALGGHPRHLVAALSKVSGSADPLAALDRLVQEGAGSKEGR